MGQETCIFCKIVNGEIPSATIYEDEFCRVILDIAPMAKGHAILLVKKHYPDLFAIDPDTASGVLCAAAKVGEAMKKALSCDGINLLQNNGPAAGQTVFHLHFHLIPRWNGDGLSLGGPQGSCAEGEAAKIAEQIRSCME